MALYLTRFSYTPETWARLAQKPEGPTDVSVGGFHDRGLARSLTCVGVGGLVRAGRWAQAGVAVNLRCQSAAQRAGICRRGSPRPPSVPGCELTTGQPPRGHGDTASPRNGDRFGGRQRGGQDAASCSEGSIADRLAEHLRVGTRLNLLPEVSVTEHSLIGADVMW
jgi:hypothetical protein